MCAFFDRYTPGPSPFSSVAFPSSLLLRSPVLLPRRERQPPFFHVEATFSGKRPPIPPRRERFPLIIHVAEIVVSTRALGPRYGHPFGDRLSPLTDWLSPSWPGGPFFGPCGPGWEITASATSDFASKQRPWPATNRYTVILDSLSAGARAASPLRCWQEITVFNHNRLFPA